MSASQPLTRLLLAATLSLTAVCVMLASGNHGERATQLATALYLSQIGLLSLWLGLGATRFRMRVSVWTAGIALALLLCPDDDSRLLSGALAAMFGAAVALLATALRARWQFSVMHLLIWTTFTALIAAAVRLSDLPLIDGLGTATMGGSFVLIPVAAYLLLADQRQPWFRLACLLLSCCTLSVCASLTLHGTARPTFDLLAIYLVQGVVTGVWIVVLSYEGACPAKALVVDRSD